MLRPAAALVRRKNTIAASRTSRFRIVRGAVGGVDRPEAARRAAHGTPADRASGRP